MTKEPQLSNLLDVWMKANFPENELRSRHVAVWAYRGQSTMACLGNDVHAWDQILNVSDPNFFDKLLNALQRAKARIDSRRIDVEGSW